jgi:hypothetical protein
MQRESAPRRCRKAPAPRRRARVSGVAKSRCAIRPAPQLTRGSGSLWCSSWARCGEQSASEEPILDSGELCAALTLTELEPARWLERSEDIRVGVPLGQPRARRDGELGCEVAFFHCRETRRVEQTRLRAAGGDCPRSGAYRSPTSGRSEPFSYIDRR